MATPTDYKGLEVLDPQPNGAGGLAIQNDFKKMVDWHPKSNWEATDNPGSSDDETSDYQVGSLWLNTTGRALFICADATEDAAKWQMVPFIISLDAAANAKPKLAADLDTNGKQISSSGNANVVLSPDGTGVVYVTSKVGIGTYTPDAMLQVEDTSGAGHAALQLKGFGDNTADTRLGAIQFYNSDTTGEGPQIAGQLTAYSSQPSGAGCYFTWGTTIGTDFTDASTPPPERMRLTASGELGIGTPAPKARLHSTGSTILGAADSTVADGDLGAGEVNVSVDETNHTLVFKVKYSDGTTVKSGTVALS